ncbi:MAG: hypothetical protein SGBAC_010222 [Bacillariaceae sp.]
MEPAETDESGSLHFEAPKNEDTASLTEPKVSFNDRVHCRRSKKHHMIPERSWFSNDEITRFRRRDKVLQSLIAPSTISFVGESDTEEVSFVGLVSQAERKQRNKRIKKTISHVLGEQMRQEDEFYNNLNDSSESFKLDQGSIADFYSIYSKRALKVAHMKGLQVSWHVESLFEEQQESIDIAANQRSDSQGSKSCHGQQGSSSIRATGNLITRFTTATATKTSRV